MLLRKNAKSLTHKASYLLIVVALLLTVSLLAVPAASLSSNRCSTCHGSKYNQQIDLLESDSRIILPHNLAVGKTANVTVAVENINNSPQYNSLTVKVTLSSQNGHFKVAKPTYVISNMPTGTAVASWQITGISTGADSLLITAQASNSHFGVVLNDNFAFNPALNVAEANSNSTTSPTPITGTSAQPTQSPPPPTQTPTPTASSSTHELNSIVLYVHPPLAIAGYVFIFALAALAIKEVSAKNRTAEAIGAAAWVLTLLGLVSGMIWAQSTWGSFWSWDPKETVTLALFLVLSFGEAAYFGGQPKAAKALMGCACILVVAAVLMSVVPLGLHSFG